MNPSDAATGEPATTPPDEGARPTPRPTPDATVTPGPTPDATVTPRHAARARSDDAGVEVVGTATITFEAFYLSNHATVARALALTLGDSGLGVEAADEAMTRAYQRWSQVQGYRNPAGWVYRVGLNWARSFLRKRKRTSNSPFLDDVPVEDPQPADPALARALASLDPKHRSVVVLRYLLDWSVDQTAEALDIAPGTVKSRLHRALAQLETQMGSSQETP